MRIKNTVNIFFSNIRYVYYFSLLNILFFSRNLKAKNTAKNRITANKLSDIHDYLFYLFSFLLIIFFLLLTIAIHFYIRFFYMKIVLPISSLHFRKEI